MSITGLASRGVVIGATENQKRSLKVELYAGETREQMEHFEPYGFTSSPLTDGEAECIALFFGGDRSHGVIPMVIDRRYRPKNLKPGEVCLFDNLGRLIYISAAGIKIDGASSNVTITTGANVVVNAANAEITATLTKINGDCVVAGNFTAANGACKMTSSGMSTSGDITAGSISLKTHKHTGVESGGSTSGGPV